MEKTEISIQNAARQILASGQERIWYDAPYEPGDAVSITVAQPGFYVICLEDTMGEQLVYMKDRTFRFEIPFEEGRLCYNPRAFVGAAHYFSTRPATDTEVHLHRDLARNVYDCHGNTVCFPHASANVETRGESVFAARNAIDGVIAPWCHGAYPFTSWGINRDPNAAWRLDFGRKVRVDALTLYLRADFPHDAWWNEIRLSLSDGQILYLPLEKTGQAQHFDLQGAEIEWLVLDQLKKADDTSPFPALTQVQVWGCEVNH